MTVDQRDRVMIGHAAARGPVAVTTGPRVRFATLVAWRPHRGNGTRRNTARVEFPSGARCSVSLDSITLIETAGGDLRG